MASSQSLHARDLNHQGQAASSEVELSLLSAPSTSAGTHAARDYAARENPQPDHRGARGTSRPSAPLPTSKPKSRPKSRWASFQQHLDDSWTSEICATVLSAVCLVAIAVVLRAFDGRPVPDLPDIVNLNAIVSILSTVSRTSLMYAVSAAVGQAKWGWFDGRSQSLEDFEVLDEASRGPLGSFQLFLGKTYSSIASIGAIVTILALAADPFVQQVITVSSDPVTGESDAAWTGKMTVPSQYYYNNTNQHPNDVLETVNSAIWNKKSIFDRRAHCPTGNCTWNSFTSLDWCARSSDVIDLNTVKMNCSIAYNKADFASIYKEFSLTGSRTTSSRDCEIQLPNAAIPLTYPIQFSLEGGRGPLVTNPSGQEPNFATNFPLEFIAPLHIFNGTTSTDTYLDVENPILALGHARFSQDDNTTDVMRLEALEQSVLSLCVRDMNVTVRDGETLTETSGDNFGRFFVDDSATKALGGGAWCWSPESDVAAVKFTSSPQVLNGIAFLVDASTTSFCTSSDLLLGSDISRRLSSALVSKHVHASSGAAAGNASTSYEQGTGISSEDILQRIASQSLVNVTDTIGASLNSLYYDQTAESALGSSIAYTAFTHVRWEWLVFPIILETLGIVFLLIILYRNRAKPVWKGSILAALYHGLDRESSGMSLQTASGMGEAAKATRVRLVFSHELEKMILR